MKAETLKGGSSVYAPFHPMFNRITARVEKLYQLFGILDPNNQLNEDPNYYFVIEDLGLKAAAGLFLSDGGKLPLDKVLKRGNKQDNEVEVGRVYLSLKNLDKKNSLKELFIDMHHFISENLFLKYNALFETHSCIVKMVRQIFGEGFIVPVDCEVCWDKVPPERRGFYKKFQVGDAGLYRANLEIFQ